MEEEPEARRFRGWKDKQRIKQGTAGRNPNPNDENVKQEDEKAVDRCQM